MAQITGEALHAHLPGGVSIRVYGAELPAVTSVNGMTGDVQLALTQYRGRYQNDAAKIGAIVSVANTYYANRLDAGGTARFVYSQGSSPINHSPFVQGNIDCSTLAGLILRGLRYEHSPYRLAEARGYARGESVPKSVYNYQTDLLASPNYGWAINPFCWDAEYSFNYSGDYDDDGNPVAAGDADDPEAHIADDATAISSVRTAAQIAQLLCEIGEVVPITEDFSAIEPGDFLFWASKTAYGAWTKPERFMHITHVAVVTEVCDVGSAAYDAALSALQAADPTIRAADAARWPKAHVYLESARAPVSNGADCTIHKDILESSAYHPAETLVLVCRPHLSRARPRFRIRHNPVSVRSTPNGHITFAVGADGERLSYRWQYSDDDGETWTDSGVSVNGPVFTTRATEQRDGRLYRCVVTDAYGRSKTSRSASITVLYDFRITSQPHSLTTAANSTAVFCCAANGDALSYQWQFSDDGGAGWTDSHVSGSSPVYASRADSDRSGRLFRCVITDAYGNTATTDPATLTVTAS